jgi:hypothetical protein
MSTSLAFAMYKPREGAAAQMAAILKEHLPLLKRLGFATERSAYTVQSTDGTIIEIFEWAGEEAKRAAHQHPEVAALWKRMEGLCDFPVMKELPESGARFPNFKFLF